MSPREFSPDIPDADARESVRRLIDLIQVLLPDRPGAVYAIERCALALVVDEMRHKITERLRSFSPEDVAAVEALTAQLERNHKNHGGDDPAA